jgi:hypothetical protein
VDGSWVRLNDSLAPEVLLVDSAGFEASVAFGLAGVSYELPLDWPASIELYLAARWWHVDAEANVDLAGPGATRTGGMTEVWADAIVGTRIRYAITEKWRVTLTGDIGAGNADLDWNVLGSVGYMFTPHLGMTAGYRIMGVDYSNAGFVYDIRQSGLLLGFNLAY